MTAGAALVANPRSAVGLNETSARVFVDTPAGERRFELSRPALDVLRSFAQPAIPDEVVERAAPRDRAFVTEAIAELRACEVLVEVGADAAITTDERLCLLTRMSEALHRMAGDISCLSATTDIDGIDGRLRQVHADLLALEGDYLRRARQLSERQLESLRPPKGASLLNLGAGSEPIEGWISLDAGEAAVSHNLLRPLPFPDRSIDFVFLSHVLEHFHHPVDAVGLLREIRRVLSPSGAVRIVVPDIAQCLLAYARGDGAFFTARDHALFGRRDRDATLLEHFLHYAGAEPAPGLFMRSHKFGYDIETLVRIVEQAGLLARPSQFMKSDFPELRIDDQSRTASARVGDIHLSLFLDGVAPPPSET